jgi:Holliday junction resolvasome RuvABC endonuclease subunit
MKLAGIDYSLSSPGICVLESTGPQFYFLTSVKKMVGEVPMFSGTFHPANNCEQQRYMNNAKWAQAILEKHGVTHVGLEDYAMRAQGRVFHIAENTAILKHMMWMNEIPFTTFAPTDIKKFATGKGNAKKDAMESAFIAQTGIDVKGAIGQNPKLETPSSDLIDAYFVAKRLERHLQEL